MTWRELFDAATAYEVNEGEVRAALDDRRDE